MDVLRHAAINSRGGDGTGDWLIPHLPGEHRHLLPKEKCKLFHIYVMYNCAYMSHNSCIKIQIRWALPYIHVCIYVWMQRLESWKKKFLIIKGYLNIRMDQIISCLKGNLKCCWALVNTGENFFPGPVSTILLSSKLWSYLSIRDSMRRAKLSYENSSLLIVRRINFFKWWESIRLNDCKDQCIQNVQPTVSLPIFQCVR